MPKSRRVIIIPCPKSPYTRMSNNSNKEYDNILCPICMEHPHNAVLLICSAHRKGCRPYICNHPIQSPCLAGYRAMSETGQLSCPLCRGHVRKELVVDGARKYLDSKKRECRKHESCGFSGTRRELMGHWWVRHASEVAKSEEEQRREREWRRLQREWELQEIQEALGGPITVVPVHDTSAEDSLEGATSADSIPSAMSADSSATAAYYLPNATSAGSSAASAYSPSSATSADSSATSAAVVGGPARPARVRKNARMCVGGHIMGRQLAPQSLPGCLGTNGRTSEL